MTKWPSPIENSLSIESIWQALQVFFYGLTQVGDGLTSATPLDYIKTELLQGQILPDITIQNVGLATILTSNQIISLAYLLGGMQEILFHGIYP
jgi:electron transport complex protein RnfD